MFQDQFLLATFVIAILYLIFIIPTYVVIISYYKTKHIKTLLTHAECIIYHYTLLYLCFPLLMDTIRIVSGSIHPTLCWWNIFFKNMCAYGIELACILSFIIRVSITKHWL